MPVFLKSSVRSIQLTFCDCRRDGDWDKTGTVVYQRGVVLVKFQKEK